MLGTMGTGEFNIGSMATQSAAALIGGALLAIFTCLVSRMRAKPTATNAPA